ncbi:hypothetical protein CEY11_05395 [Candidimonas nitroreducens]|uniref:Uncharacterized protein n=1 Tax=Candidimonas nitroreducens TaxID=683354 RepID=A0A225MVA5_9BURK|nr:hypothetical protein CEY11_05395 [Candidimonas nitroreducens]
MRRATPGSDAGAANTNSGERSGPPRSRPCAKAYPMPEAPPVTSTTFDCLSMAFLSLSSRPFA